MKVQLLKAAAFALLQASFGCARREEAEFGTRALRGVARRENDSLSGDDYDDDFSDDLDLFEDAYADVDHWHSWRKKGHRHGKHWHNKGRRHANHWHNKGRHHWHPPADDYDDEFDGGLDLSEDAYANVGHYRWNRPGHWEKKAHRHANHWHNKGRRHANHWHNKGRHYWDPPADDYDDEFDDDFDSSEDAYFNAD